MDTNVLVSIIIPVFNVRPYLVEAIESVINQTYQNLEIIIIDDGSTDGSSEICDDFARHDCRIRVIHKENRGLSAARNAGLDISSGNAIAFLDSDDAYHKKYIEKMLSAMAQEEVDLVICKYQVNRSIENMSFDDKLRAIPLIEAGRYDRLHALYSLVDGSINPMVWNKLYKRELWDEIRFPEGHVHEDIDITYRILDRCQKICVVIDSLYLRRIRSGSITNKATRSNAEDCIMALSHFEEYVRLNIPGTFKPEHLKLTRIYKLDWMVHYYVQLVQENKDNAFCNELRESIFVLKNTFKMDGVGLIRTLRYWLICYFPWLLRILYPVYKGIQKISEKRVQS